MLIGLCGYKRAGKSTVANVLVDECGFTNINFADALRMLALGINPVVGYALKQALVIGGQPQLVALYYAEIIEAVGYERAKEIDEVRRFLQRLGTEGIRDTFGPDVWVEIVRQQLDVPGAAERNVVIADVRFPNEAAMVTNLGGELWRINRPGFDRGGDAHPSEAFVDAMEVDRDITATDIEDLRRQARGAVNRASSATV